MSLRILFICGCAEPGRDGVGDYVRRLSLDLIAQGHLVAVAAINDKYVTELEGAGKAFNQGQLSVCRLPAVMDEAERMTQLKNWVELLKPDYLSLQYVPFSFNPKGLIFGLTNNLAAAGGNRKWHIMFHELWVGMTTESTLKERLWGAVQRYLTKGLLKGLKPAVVHTHTDLYKKQLERIGAQVTLLPLFSNIPVLHPAVVAEKMTKSVSLSKRVSIVIFGGIHGGAPIQDLAADVQAFQQQHKLEVELIIIGRSGREQERWVEEWTKAGLLIRPVGEQSEAQVSQYLEAAQVGIFTTPIALVEKSGSVAAMREHGIQLLCVSRDWTPKLQLEKNPFHIMEYKKGNLEAFFKQAPDFTYMPTLSKVSAQFIANLLTK